MLERNDCETLLLEHLAWIRTAMTRMCRRYHMPTADTEDFVSWATMRLVENDYQVLRRFRGESSIRTYLTVVIAMFHREYRAQYWGRWRPSAAARRDGGEALELDRLVRRDGVSIEQAVRVVRSRGATTMTERQLMQLAASLPPRTAACGVELLELTRDPIAALGTDDALLASEDAAHRASVEQAIAAAMDRLAAEDRRLVSMRFWDGMTIAEIARVLEIPQKPLYRRMVRALGALRRWLEEAGVSPTDALTVLEGRAA